MNEDIEDQSPVPGGTTAIRDGRYVTEERAPGPEIARYRKALEVEQALAAEDRSKYEAALDRLQRALDGLVEALTNEDKIAHGEAWSESANRGGHSLGFCAYCGDAWPCRTQRAIDAALAAAKEDGNG